MAKQRNKQNWFTFTVGFLVLGAVIFLTSPFWLWGNFQAWRRNAQFKRKTRSDEREDPDE